MRPNRAFSSGVGERDFL
uniref:Uncharacterized protein n=1 Tax=Rhizophora mucronata TaxID=61149 RepID=A0A2P2NQJ6_RHIMU